MHVTSIGRVKSYGNSIKFFAKKYWTTVYIFESCSLKNTSLSIGNVNTTGDRAPISEKMQKKNKNPVIEFQNGRTM